MTNLWHDFRWWLHESVWDDYFIAAALAALPGTFLVRFLLQYIPAQDLVSYPLLAVCCYYSRGLLSPRRNK